MGEAVRESLARWEPRATVTDIRLDPSSQDSGQVLINVEYTVRTTNDRRNLVYPFYVIPREDEP
jgi:phage baseplate assembly protein W